MGNVDVVICVDDVDIAFYGWSHRGSENRLRITGGETMKTLYGTVAALALMTATAHAQAISVLVEGGGHSLQTASRTFTPG